MFDAGKSVFVTTFEQRLSRMKYTYQLFLFLSIASMVGAKQRPYDRYLGESSRKSKWTVRKKAIEPAEQPLDGFLHWLHHVIANDPDDGALSQAFTNGSIPPHAALDELIDRLNVPPVEPSQGPALPLHLPPRWPDQQAEAVFSHLPYTIDPQCTSNPSKW